MTPERPSKAHTAALGPLERQLKNFLDLEGGEVPAMDERVEFAWRHVQYEGSSVAKMQRLSWAQIVLDLPPRGPRARVDVLDVADGIMREILADPARVLATPLEGLEARPKPCSVISLRDGSVVGATATEPKATAGILQASAREAYFTAYEDADTASACQPTTYAPPPRWRWPCHCNCVCRRRPRNIVWCLGASSVIAVGPGCCLLREGTPVNQYEGRVGYWRVGICHLCNAGGVQAHAPLLRPSREIRADMETLDTRADAAAAQLGVVADHDAECVEASAGDSHE